jgi:hypothetical protein
MAIFSPQDAIEKSRFPDIGPSQNGDETAFKRRHELKIASSGVMRPEF